MALVQSLFCAARYLQKLKQKTLQTRKHSQHSQKHKQLIAAPKIRAKSLSIPETLPVTPRYANVLGGESNPGTAEAEIRHFYSDEEVPSVKDTVSMAGSEISNHC